MEPDQLSGRAAHAIQERRSNIRTYLIDPPGSSLHNKVALGVLYTRQEAEGKRLRNPYAPRKHPTDTTRRFNIRLVIADAWLW